MPAGQKRRSISCWLVHQTIFISTVSLQSTHSLFHDYYSLSNFKAEKFLYRMEKHTFGRKKKFVNCFAFGKPVNQSVLEIAPLERSKVIAIKRIKTAPRPFPFFFVLCIAETAVCILGDVNNTIVNHSFHPIDFALWKLVEMCNMGLIITQA